MSSTQHIQKPQRDKITACKVCGIRFIYLWTRPNYCTYHLDLRDQARRIVHNRNRAAKRTGAKRCTVDEVFDALLKGEGK